MSLFERIQKKIIIESSSDTTGQNKKKKKEFSSNISRTVKVSKDTEGLGNRQSRIDATDPKQGGYSRVDDTIDDLEYKKAKTMGTPTKTIGSMKTYNANKNNRPPRKGVDYFFDAEKAKKAKDEFRKGRKAYTDSTSGIKAGKVTQKGIVNYITKARDLNQGTNANTKANRKAAEIIAKSSGSEYAEKIRDKYETDNDLSRRRGKNQPSYAEVKKGIDKKNPTYLSPTKTMGVKGDMKNRPLPLSTRKTKPKLIQTKVSDKEIQDLIKQGRQTKPTKTKRITAGTLGARDKAIKDLDDLIIEPKKSDIAKTKTLIKKERKKIVKNITSPKPDEIKIQKNIIKQGPKATPFVTSDTKSLDDFIKAKDPFNVKGEKPKGSSTGGGPNQNPEYQRLLDQQRRNQQAYDAFDDSDAGRPGTGNTIDNTTTRNRTTSKPETKPKSSKKFNGKSFDELIKDAKKKNKQLEKEIKGFRTKSFVPPNRTAPNTNPFKFERIKNINRTRTKPGTFRMSKTPKFKPRTSTAAKLGKYAFGAYLASQIFGGGKGPGIFPAKDNRPEIKKGAGGDIKFTLAGTRPPEK